MTSEMIFLVEMKEPITIFLSIIYHLVQHYFPRIPSKTDMTE